MMLVDKAETLDKLALITLCIYAITIDISMALANGALDLCLFLWLIRSWMLKDCSLPNRKVLGLFALLFISLVISALFAYDPALSKQPIWNIFYYMVVPYAIAWRFVRSTKQAVLILSCMILSVSISSVYAVWQSSQGVSHAIGFIHMLETATHVAQLSPFLVAGLILLIPVNRGFAVGVLSCSFLFLAALVATKNRQTWIAQGSTIIMQLAISKTSPRIKWGILVGILLMVSTIFCVSPTARQRLESITDMKGLSVTYRFSMWSSAWQQFVDHPVIGIGLGNAPAVHSRYVLPDRAHLPSTQHPHSVPIQLLAETGLVGTTAYYSLYGYVLMLLFRQRQRGSVFATAMIISIVAVQICSLTENLLYGVLAVKQSEWFLIGVFAGEHLNLSSSDLPIWGKRSL